MHYIKPNLHLESQLKNKKYDTINDWLSRRIYDNAPLYDEENECDDPLFIKAIDMKRWPAALSFFKYRHNYDKLTGHTLPTNGNWYDKLYSLKEEAEPSLNMPELADDPDMWKDLQKEVENHYYLASMQPDIAMIKYFLTAIPLVKARPLKAEIEEHMVKPVIDVLGKDQALLFFLQFQPVGLNLHQPLLAAGASPNAYAEHPFSGIIEYQCLSLAFRRNDLKAVKDLLSAKTNLHWKFHNGRTPIEVGSSYYKPYNIKNSKEYSTHFSYYTERLNLLSKISKNIPKEILREAYSNSLNALSQDTPTFTIEEEESLPAMLIYYQHYRQLIDDFVPFVSPEHIKTATKKWEHLLSNNLTNRLKNGNFEHIRSHPVYQSMHALLLQDSLLATESKPSPKISMPRF